MRVVIDLDGVIFDFMRHWRDRLFEKQGKYVDLRISSEYDTIHLQAGMTKPEFWEWYQRTGGFDQCPRYEGARGMLDRLHEQENLEVILATNRPQWAGKQTMGSIKRLPHDGFYMGPDKLHLDADLWIDDNPRVIDAVRERHGQDAAVTVRRRWNTGAPPVVTHTADIAGAVLVRLEAHDE